MTDTILFESAEMGSNGLKQTLYMPKASVRLTCTAGQVQFDPLTPRGAEIAKTLAPQKWGEGRVRGSLQTRLKSPSPLDAIRALAKHGTVLGIFSYDLIDLFEDLPAPQRDPLKFPDFIFWLPEILIKGEQEPTHHSKHFETPRTEATSDLSDDEFASLVVSLKTHILSGDVFQIVPSRTFQLPCPDPKAAYERLRQQNPSPYMFYIDAPDFTLFGASPETFVKVTGQEKKTVEIHPIAGTRKRGSDLELDSRIEAELRRDEKELAEHLMLVDLARNDIARVSKPGSRVVDKLLSVARYSKVMHLCSRVRGELREDLDALHAYQASINMGTLMGAPKIKAAEILRRVEPSKRGPYGGAVGYLTPDGQMDTAIVIRSALVKDGMAYIRAGAGVVHDSDPMAEALETRAKAEAVIAAVVSHQ